MMKRIPVLIFSITIAFVMLAGLLEVAQAQTATPTATPTVTPTPTITPTPVLFPTPITSSFIAIPTALPIPTAVITISLVPTTFWDIDNFEFSISIAQTVFNLPYMDNVLEVMIYMGLITIGLALMRAILGGRAQAQQQTAGIIQDVEQTGDIFTEAQRQQLIAEEVARVRRQETARRFRREIGRGLGGRRRRR